MATKSSVISWGSVAGAVDYEVVVVDSNGNANPPFLSAVLNSFLTGGAVSALGVDVFGGLAGGDYRIQVRAIASNPAENSDFTAPINVTYDPKLSVPSGLSVS